MVTPHQSRYSEISASLRTPGKAGSQPLCFLPGLTVCTFQRAQHCRRNRTWLRAPREPEAVDERATGVPWATAQGAVTVSPAPHQTVWVPHAYLSIRGKVTGVAYTHFYSEKSILTQPKK